MYFVLTAFTLSWFPSISLSILTNDAEVLLSLLYVSDMYGCPDGKAFTTKHISHLDITPILQITYGCQLSVYEFLKSAYTDLLLKMDIQTLSAANQAAIGSNAMMELLLSQVKINQL